MAMYEFKINRNILYCQVPTVNINSNKNKEFMLNMLEEVCNLPLKTLQSTLFDSDVSEIYTILQLLLEYLSCSSELSPLLYLCTSNWKQKCTRNMNWTWILTEHCSMSNRGLYDVNLISSFFFTNILFIFRICFSSL